jgi:hypothetical protein
MQSEIIVWIITLLFEPITEVFHAGVAETSEVPGDRDTEKCAVLVLHGAIALHPVMKRFHIVRDIFEGPPVDRADA